MNTFTVTLGLSAVFIFVVFSNTVNGDRLMLIPDRATMWVVEPEPLILQCLHIGLTAPLNFVFIKDNIIDTSKLNFKKISRSTANGTMTITTMNITLARSLVNYTGTYKCAEESMEKEINVRVIKVPKSLDVGFYKEGEPITFSCDVKGADINEVANVWHKNGIPLDTNIEAKYFLNDSLSLTILDPEIQDAGQYSCNMTFSKGESSERHVNQAVYYYAKPLADMKERKSRDLKYEATLILKCYIFGYPTPNVTWYKDNKELDPLEDRHITIKSHGLLPVSELNIVELTFEDRGDYSCEVSSEKFPNNTMRVTVLIRVKDKLAPLWPFLGIVVQIIILCIIIFTCQKWEKCKRPGDDAPKTE